MDICGDNRFEIIAKAKKHLLDATNIDTSPKEMEVLDDFLFRCWQMGWLDRYDTADTPQTDLSTEEFVEGMKNLRMEVKQMDCNNCAHWEHGAGQHYYCALLEMGQECYFESKDESTLMFANVPQTDCEKCEHWKYIAHEWQCETEKCQKTPQTDCDKCIWSVCNYNKVDWDADTPQTESHITCYGTCTDKCGAYENGDCTLNARIADTPQTDCAWMYDSRRDYEYDKALDEMERNFVEFEEYDDGEDKSKEVAE